MSKAERLMSLPKILHFQDEQILTSAEMMEAVAYLFMEDIPFNKVLGLDIALYTPERVELRFQKKEELIGNNLQKSLHGGVTAAVLDTVGGLLAIRTLFQEMGECSYGTFLRRFSTIGTIDMRVDYLRPGRGTEFVASAEILRLGKKIAVCRMELHNEHRMQIAAATASYIVG